MISAPRRPFAAVLLVTVLLSLIPSGCGQLQVSKYYERGAITTVTPIATEVGRQVFMDGGNAFDAAVAVGFMLAVVHPQAGNLGGGGFAVLRNGADGQILTLDFRETAPQNATEDMFLDDSGEVVPDLSTIGALASGVPGSVAGLHELWSRFGSLPWEDLVTPAAWAADTGFIVDSVLASDFSIKFDRLNKFEETARLYFPDGRAPMSGERLVLKDLATTLYRIASEGPDVFYKGEIATLIDSCMRRHGGLITSEDMARYSANWREPIHIRFDSLDIYSMAPPSSGGIAVGQILKLLEPYDFSTMTSRSPEYVRLFVESARLAFADRSLHLGDPGYYPVPATLLSEKYIESRRDQIPTDRAGSSEEIHPGSPPIYESEQTTHFSICDADGNMVAITTTINNSFGSFLVVDGAGFLLNNHMDDFSIKPGYANLWGLVGGQANKIEPGKRMLSSMSPTIVLRKDKPFLITGSPGGSKIITTVAQSILNFTRFGMTLDETVRTARFHHQWLPDRIDFEQGKFSPDLLNSLRDSGYQINERTDWGDLHMIYIDESGLMQPAADYRRGGMVSGY